MLPHIDRNYISGIAHLYRLRLYNEPPSVVCGRYWWDSCDDRRMCGAPPQVTHVPTAGCSTNWATGESGPAETSAF